MYLFWPSVWPTVLVLDDSAEDRAFAEELPAWVRVRFRSKTHDEGKGGGVCICVGNLGAIIADISMKCLKFVTG